MSKVSNNKPGLGNPIFDKLKALYCCSVQDRFRLLFESGLHASDIYNIDLDGSPERAVLNTSSYFIKLPNDSIQFDILHRFIEAQPLPDFITAYNKRQESDLY